MKKVFPVIMVCIAMGVISSCEKTSLSGTTQQKLIGKWILKSAIGSYTVQGSNHKDTTRYTLADFFEFKTDGILNITVTNATHNGKWKVTNNKLYITETNYVDYPNGFDLAVLTTTDLQLYSYESTSTTATEQKLIFNK